jgi:hypothetical protein
MRCCRLQAASPLILPPIRASRKTTAPACDVERIRACAVKGEDIKLVEGVAYVRTPNAFETCKMAK